WMSQQSSPPSAPAGAGAALQSLGYKLHRGYNLDVMAGFRLQDQGGLAMLVTPMAVVALGFAFMSASGMEGRPDGTDAKGGADKSLKTVKTWLKGLCKGEPQGLSKIEAVDAAVRRLFPDEQFYSVRFMRYPRAVKPPAPLKLENLVGVHADGSVERIDSLDALKTLLEKKLADVRTEEQARSALLASLRLAQEFYQ